MLSMPCAWANSGEILRRLPDECPDAKPRDESKVKFITPTF